MRMSCSGWVSGGAAPPMVLAPPDSLAYRRYLRFLPSQEESGGKFLALEGAEGLGPQGRLVDLRRQGEAGYEHEGVQYQNPKIGSSGTAEIEGGKLGDKVADVSVSSRVQQYTAMLRARHSAQYNTPLQTSRSCSSIVFRSSRRSLFFRSAEGHESSGKEGPDESGCESSRNGSVDSGEGEAAFSPRYRSFSLPWPSDPTWRWSSDPNITSMAGVQSSAFGSVGGRRASDQHSASLVRLDSATSDEGCPRDGSTGPTPPPSPVFRLSAANHLMGLITPFKSLSPASSMGSHLGSVEDLPLMRSRSLGHVPDHWARSHSADSAVEVEEESTIVSPALSPAVPPADAPEALSGYLAGGEQVNGGPEAGASGTCDACSDERKLAAAERGQCSDDKCPADGPCVPNGDIVFGESDGESHAYCDCNENCEKDVSVVRESVDDCLRTVELRKKLGQSGNRRERRHGGVNGEVLFRHARACGVVQSPEDREAAGKKVLRTPSVVISDHSGDTISLTVALASSDFSIDQLGKMEKLRESASPTLSAGDDNASRKVSSCSSCSSVSTVDMTTPLTTISLDSLIEVPNRRISDCSTCSNVTASEDEVEHELSRPPPPRKVSLAHVFSSVLAARYPCAVPPLSHSAERGGEGAASLHDALSLRRPSRFCKMISK
ncbi:uncharacterized protein LOC119575537 [Penaeus monodon]|uniref:uncharacterized protein LOC119575537 n=1 Tax=Penaeus monodon TaxID=6687 RepID=UPI0018A746C4|nr:uncharacterized protein LOC119575537 [Penaeus monodon]